VTADDLRGDLLGLPKRGHGVGDVPPLGMRAGDIDQHRACRSRDRPEASAAEAARSARPAAPSSTATAISYSATLAGLNSVL
jgi:hypothetical protein